MRVAGTQWLVGLAVGDNEATYYLIVFIYNCIS
jgi:hypothetical protein